MKKKVKLDKDILNDLVEFYNEQYEYKIDKRKAIMLCELGKKLMADLWNLLVIEQKVEVNEYYRICPYGPFELAFANTNQGNASFRDSVVRLSSGDILDYGGGDGSLSIRIAEKGAFVTYVDIDSINMDFAKWKFERACVNIKILEGMKDQDEIWTNHYDTVICIEVIEHVLDPEELLRKLVAAIKPGGKLIITRLECPGPTPDLPLHFRLPFDGKRLLVELGLQETVGAFNGDRSLWIKV